MTQLSDVLKFLIEHDPGRTEAELSEVLYGDSAYQQKVNGYCWLLAERGEVQRRGGGGLGDPFK